MNYLKKWFPHINMLLIRPLRIKLHLPPLLLLTNVATELLQRLIIIKKVEHKKGLWRLFLSPKSKKTHVFWDAPRWRFPVLSMQNTSGPPALFPQYSYRSGAAAAPWDLGLLMLNDLILNSATVWACTAGVPRWTAIVGGSWQVRAATALSGN